MSNILNKRISFNKKKSMETHYFRIYTYFTHRHAHTHRDYCYLPFQLQRETPLEDSDLLDFKCLQFNKRKGYLVAHDLERSWLNTPQPVGSKDLHSTRCSRDSRHLTILDAKTGVLIVPLGSNSKVDGNSRFFSKTNFGIKLFSKRKTNRTITGSHDPMCGWYSPFSCG